MNKLSAVCFLAICLVATPGLAQEAVQPACLGNENLRHFREPRSPRLSPDGRRVVFAIQEGAAERGVSHLWWAEVAQPESARQITFSAGEDHDGETDPQWMPDGTAILFLAKRDQHKQIYRLPTAVGEASPLKMEISAPKSSATNGEGKGAATGSRAAADSSADNQIDVDDYAISPDGKSIAVLAKEPETAEEKKRKKDKDDALVVDHERRHERAWLYSLAGGTLEPVGNAKREAMAVAWSRDSARLGVISRQPGNSDDLGPAHTVEVVEVANPKSSRVVRGIPPTVESIVWSPSGDRLALLAQSSHDAPPGMADLYVISSAGGEPQDISASSSEMIASRSLEWTTDGAGVYSEIQKGTSVAPMLFSVKGKRPEIFPSNYPVATSFSTNLNQTGWTFIAESSDRPPEVMFTADLRKTAGAVRLSRTNPRWPDEGWTRAKPVEWASTDGMKISGLLFWPPAKPCAGQPARPEKIPLIVEVHGGPTGAWLEYFSPFTHFLLAQGWAVLEPNPRGSTGYGWDFVAANKNDLGGKDYEDVMAGVDWVLAHEPVAPDHLGLYGYSYGGEMAGFVEGRTGRFAAIISGAPVIDQYSEYGTEGGSWYDRWFFGQPWRRPADAWRQSPLAKASEARTPFLLLQGEADKTDPLGQSQEMYRALRQEGVPVEMVQYPRESHGGLGRGILGLPSREPWHGFDARKHILEWFRSHFPNK